MNGVFRTRTAGDASTLGPEDRLAALGLTLPALRPAAGSYRGYVQAGDLLFLAGQGADGWTGQVGVDLPVDRARVAARDCMLNLLAQTRAALGSLDRVRKVVKVLGFVASTPQFRYTPAVLDGA
jgi:enamine deaminase RidA (YjgF/YER057c/UK114 family)